jgi:AraC-like DNA-binding protein
MPKVIEKNIENQFEAITVLDLQDKYFDPNWHFHPHYQIFTVIEGAGTRFIGDNIQTFEQGDTVMIGPNLPHLWRSDKVYFDPEYLHKSHGIVVYFSENFLGSEFLEKSEMQNIKRLFDNSKRGMVIHQQTREITIAFLQRIALQKGFDRILTLLELLHLLSNSTEWDPICSSGYVNSYKISETERMQKVHEFVLKNFKEEISLAEVAEIVNMSISAFCRYFKKRANKTFLDFVNEIRIGNACKLLNEDKYSIAEIAFESGFNSISNFNSQFRKMMGCSPREYMKTISNAEDYSE